MGLFRRAEQTDTVLSLYERLSSIGWVGNVIVAAGGAMSAWAASATDWLSSYGPIAWVVAGLSASFILALALLMIALAVAALRPQQKPSGQSPVNTNVSSPLERVVGQIFENTAVPIDNRFFLDCKFVNATLLWDGGNTQWQGAKFEGKTRLESRNGVVVGTVNVLKSMGWLTPEFASDWQNF